MIRAWAMPSLLIVHWELYIRVVCFQGVSSGMNRHMRNMTHMMSMFMEPHTAHFVSEWSGAFIRFHMFVLVGSTSRRQTYTNTVSFSSIKENSIIYWLFKCSVISKVWVEFRIRPKWLRTKRNQKIYHWLPRRHVWSKFDVDHVMKNQFMYVRSWMNSKTMRVFSWRPFRPGHFPRVVEMALKISTVFPRLNVLQIENCHTFFVGNFFSDSYWSFVYFAGFMGTVFRIFGFQYGARNSIFRWEETPLDWTVSVCIWSSVRSMHACSISQYEKWGWTMYY